MKSQNPLRTKLISMMYLVLIAMIVLNPALEYIDIFTDLNRSLEYSNVRLDQKNERTVATIQTFASLDPETYEEIYSRVFRAKVVANCAIDYLETIKLDLITDAGGWDTTYHHLKLTTDATLPTRKIYKSKIATDIRQQLIETKKELLAILGEPNGAMLDTVLNLNEELPKAKRIYYQWEKYYFDNVPLGAVVAVLTKFQNDVRVAESIVIRNWHDHVQGEGGVGNYNFEFVATDTTRLDTIYLAKGVKKQDVFSVGEDGVTTITLPSQKQKDAGNAVIYVYNDNNEITDSFYFNHGMGEVKLPTDQIGEFTIKGVVKFRYPSEGEPALQMDNENFAQKQRPDEEFPFEVDYKVIDSKPFISQREYNILYLGINNPVNIFHPEYEQQDYRIKISQGKVVKVDNSYYAQVNRKGFASITLEVPDDKGGYKRVAEELFKVKELPNPQVVLYNKEGGQMPAKLFKQQKGLETVTKNMEVEADFRVIEYTVTYINSNGLGIFKEKVKGSYFTGRSRELIELAQPGDIFIFDEISVKGPDGVNKDVDALVFNIL